MPLIKQHDAVPALKEAVVLDLGDLGAQAAKLRMAAEAKASEIVMNAQREAQAMTDEAAGKGFEQGRVEGLEKGVAEGREQGHAEALAETTEQLQQIMAAWSDVAEQWDGARKQMDREARQAVLEFALKMAERLVHRVVDVDPSVIVDQVGNALGYVLRPMDVTVRIHPDDRPMLTKAMPQLMGEFPRLEHVHLEDDPSITRGGCMVSYGQGEIDATLDMQMSRVIDLILPEEDEVGGVVVPDEAPSLDGVEGGADPGINPLGEDSPTDNEEGV